MTNLPFPTELLEILGCPACEDRPPLSWQEGALVCDKCHRAYPIRDGIPILLVEEAIPIEPPSSPSEEREAQ